MILVNFLIRLIAYFIYIFVGTLPVILGWRNTNISFKQYKSFKKDDYFKIVVKINKSIETKY